MRIALKYIHVVPKTGRLNFRRTFPSELQPYIEGKPKQLKRSLKSKDVHAPGTLALYEAAQSEYDGIINKAVRTKTCEYDTLDGPMIAYLSAKFEIDWRIPSVDCDLVT